MFKHLWVDLLKKNKQFWQHLEECDKESKKMRRQDRSKITIAITNSEKNG